MKQRLLVALGVTMMLGALAYGRTIVWGSEGGPDMEYADTAYAYCLQQNPEATYPEAGHELTPCEEEWWNDGDPLPIGGGF